MTVTIGYLYEQIINGVLDHLGPEDRYNRMAYAEKLRLQRGIDNHIKLRLRNRDQKAVNVGASQFRMTVTDPLTTREKFSITLDAVNASRGIVGGTITAAQIAVLDQALYHYGVLMIDDENRVWPVYVDDNFGSAGTVQVVGDAYPTASAAVDLDLNFSPGTNVSPVINLQDAGISGLHTAAFYCTDFTGSVIVQGHLSSTVDVTDVDFFDIQEFALENFTGLSSQNWVGMFQGIRFRVIGTAGTLNRILYRY